MSALEFIHSGTIPAVFVLVSAIALFPFLERKFGKLDGYLLAVYILCVIAATIGVFLLVAGFQVSFWAPST